MWSKDLVTLVKAESNFPLLVNHTTGWQQVMYDLYQQWILTPLIRLYLWGPSWGNWGFWGGMDMSDICSHKTGVDAHFWKHNSEACTQLVAKQFYSITVLLETGMYFYAVYFCYKYVLLHMLTLHSQWKKRS